MTFSYLMIRFFTFPFRFLPFKVLHLIGKGVGTLAYYTLTHYRKRTLSNLALAKTLHLQDLKKTAKASMQNLAITFLEYPKLTYLKKMEKILICENPDTAKELIDQKTGIIFFCGHQANWELLFLEGTQRMPGVAVGRPIKNRALYQWILSMREKFGGKVVSPKETMKEGLRALKSGKFFGIVGDQALPESSYAFDFFGRLAWTTPAPAILSYRTGCPIIVATIKRESGKYFIRYSDPIWPRSNASMEEEINRMMQTSLSILERSIRQRPEQWLWQHNRWKQETAQTVYYRYRLDTILIILPRQFDLKVIETFREIYPKAFITVLIPQETSPIPINVSFQHYAKEEELFLFDYTFKMVFNFSGNKKLRRHFLRQSALYVLDISALKKGAAQQHLLPGDDLSMLLKKALTRPNTLWKKDAS